MAASATMRPSLLQTWFPWVASPVISNGPMIGAACPRLATEITLAGGLGFNKCTVDLSPGSQHLQDLDADLAESRRLLGAHALDQSGRLRVGAAFLTLHDASIGSFRMTALPVLQKHKPVAVWLFAPSTAPTPHHGAIVRAVREGVSPPPRVFVQVGNVAAAREAVGDGADVVVAQGIDAGGHQFRRGMGVVSLVPEVREVIEEQKQAGEVAVMAAGGIVCGKGAAAAMALGADGVVMGTRFTVCPESIYPDFKKALVLSTTDGGSSTLKHHFNDNIAQNPMWGDLYDGRAVITSIHEKFLAGASLEECLRILKEEHSEEEAVKLIGTWAGTGIGRVREAKPAGEVVREVRDEAIKTAKAVAARF